MHASVLKEYARLAHRYDTRWASYVEATLRKTIDRLAQHLREGDRLLDVGCGTGVLLSKISRVCPAATLAGIDVTPEMLAIARRRLPAAVDLREGWATELPFEGESFAAVTCCSVLHCMPKPLVALREMSRVLRPGRMLVVTDWCADYLVCRMLGWCLRPMNRGVFRVCGSDELVRLLHAAVHADASVERYRIGRWWGVMTASVRKAPTLC